MRSVLELALARTGMELAVCSHFEDGEQVVDAVAGDASAFGLEVGSRIAAVSSYGALVVEGRLPNLVTDTLAHPATRTLALVHDHGIGAFLAVSLPPGEPTATGVLVCASRQPDPSLDDAAVGFLDVLSGLVAQITTGHDEASDRRRRTRDRVGRVISQGQLTTVFQPIMELATGRVVGAEALTRFPAEPARPDLWFADAESVGMGTALELAAIAEAVRHADRLPEGIYLSLNASPRTLTSPDLDAALHGVPEGCLVLELTEHAAITDYDEITGAIERLRNLGARLAVDDVGAGFSSFAHVLRLVPDIVKLDIAITRGVDEDPAKRGVARGLVSVARDIGATVVAEGVETQAELDALLDLGVDAAQGFHLARPARLPLPTDLPRPTGRLLGRAATVGTDDADALGFVARTWLQATDLETMARPILDTVLERTGLQTSYLTVADPATRALDHRYVCNVGPIDLAEGTVVPWADTLCKRCADAGIRWTSDVAVDLPGSAAAEAFGVKTFLSLPVRSPSGELLGTLCAASTEQRYIGSETLDQIELLARLVADRWDVQPT